MFAPANPCTITSALGVDPFVVRVFAVVPVGFVVPVSVAPSNR